MIRHPNIDKAILAMAYDNGGINRDRTEADCLKDADEVLGAEGVYHEDLVKIDAWIGTLTGDQINTLVAGELEEMKALLAAAPEDIRQKTNGLLNDIFENGC